MNKIGYVITIAIALVASFAALLISLDNQAKINEQNNRVTASNTYRGHYSDYSVRIEEIEKGGKIQREVHLERNDKQTDSKLPVAVTVFNYDDLGKWNQLSIRQNISDGCNTVYFKDDGTRVWNPCLGDKDRVKPFTDSQVFLAKSLVGQAIWAIYNEEHLSDNLKRSRRMDNLRYAHD